MNTYEVRGVERASGKSVVQEYAGESESEVAERAMLQGVNVTSIRPSSGDRLPMFRLSTGDEDRERLLRVLRDGVELGTRRSLSLGDAGNSDAFARTLYRNVRNGVLVALWLWTVSLVVSIGLGAWVVWGIVDYRESAKQMRLEAAATDKLADQSRQMQEAFAKFKAAEGDEKVYWGTIMRRLAEEDKVLWQLRERLFQTISTNDAGR